MRRRGAGWPPLVAILGLIPQPSLGEELQKLEAAIPDNIIVLHAALCWVV
jgi:hypothetical protein